MLIILPSSRRQRTVSGGVPVALQINVTLACSRTTTSELLRESSILGGTIFKIKITLNEIKIDFSLSDKESLIQLFKYILCL